MSERIVKLYRLRHTSEEFLATHEESGNENYISFRDPFVLVQNGNGGMGLMPWNWASVDKSFTLPISDILMVTDPMPSLKDGYLERVSGIELPKKSHNQIITG